MEVKYKAFRNCCESFGVIYYYFNSELHNLGKEINPEHFYEGWTSP